MSELNLQEILDSVSEPAAAPAPEPEASAPEPTPEPGQNMTNPEPVPEEKVEPDHYDRSWAAIKAAEKRNLAERNEVKGQRQEIDGMRAQLEAAQAEISNLKGGFKENPVDFMEKLVFIFRVHP